MHNLVRVLFGLLILTFHAPNLYAQDGDEIIVTASRIENTPSVYYTRKGDFLLLQVNIESDARDAAERLSELEKTISEFEKASRTDPLIELSFIDESDFVRVLTPALYDDAIGFGSRPDTSVARIQVKTPIPENISDAFALSRKLISFAGSVKETGRVSISNDEEVTISVVNPMQYRKDVVKVITDDINSVTAALGSTYRVILSGLDKPMKTFRSGDLSLAFYLPYEYTIIPDTLTSYHILNQEDY